MSSPFQPFVDQWAACVQQATDVTQQTLGKFEGSSDPQAWRRQWFDALSGNTDRYLRSAPFLQMMKSHVQAMVLARQYQHGPRPTTCAGAPFGPPAGSPGGDQSGRLEAAVNARLEQLEQRVSAMEETVPSPSPADGWDRFLTALRRPQSSEDPAVDQEAPTTAGLGVTPHEVVFQEGALRLLRYRPRAPGFVEPTLICFALVNRPYILDLQADRSVVRRLLDRGCDVYLIDWGVPTGEDHTLRLQDYVCRFLAKVVDVVCRTAGTRQLNLLGYCMGGTMSTMFTALRPDRVRNLVLMATPIDFSGDEGLLNLWAREEHFDVDRLVDAFGNCPGEFLQYCFQLMKPVQNFTEKYLTLCDKAGDEAFLENFFALERWASDSIPVAGETFREYVKLLYQQNQLVKGKLTLGEAAVRLREIRCPLLLLVANQDHLVPPRSTLAIEKHVGSTDVQSMSIAAGHIGLAVSSKAHRDLWPRATQWVAEHSTERH